MLSLSRHALPSETPLRTRVRTAAPAARHARVFGRSDAALSESAGQQQDEQDEQNKPAETPADSRATVVKPAAAEQQ